MDAVLPNDIAGALAGSKKLGSKKRGKKGKAGYSLRWEDGELRVVELTSTGFVVEADTPPPLRGFTNIFEGNQLILHGLAMCTWARDGLVGYEFKRGARLIG